MPPRCSSESTAYPRLRTRSKLPIHCPRQVIVRGLTAQLTQTLQVRLRDVLDLYVVEHLRAQLEQAEGEAVVFCCWILGHHCLLLEGTKDPQRGASGARQASGDFVEAEPISRW